MTRILIIYPRHSCHPRPSFMGIRDCVSKMQEASQGVDWAFQKCRSISKGLIELLQNAGAFPRP